MSAKVKEIVKLIENIGFILFGITNGIGGTYLWGVQPFLAVSLYILSLIFILRGFAELLDIILTKGRR